MSAPEISTLRPHCARWPQPAGGASACAAGGGVCACAGRGETCGWATRPSGEACPGRGRHRGCRRRRRPRAGRCSRADSRCPPADSWCCSLETKQTHAEVCITALAVTLTTQFIKCSHVWCTSVSPQSTLSVSEWFCMNKITNTSVVNAASRLRLF